MTDRDPRPSPAAIDRLRADPAFAPLHRSLTYYYGDDDRAAAADALYRRFVRPGDLVLDIGAHVGDRVASFRRLGARVVAVEPQPLCVRALEALYGDDDQVTVVPAACGAQDGILPLHVNTANPTVSSLSSDFLSAADGAQGWAQEVWDSEITVRVVTADGLIRRYGTPAFVKIDVEGYEDQVLAGLSTSPPALSFEFTIIAREVADRCLDRLEQLGVDGYDVSLGDSMDLTFGRWLSRREIADHLAALPAEANAGDVYAVRGPR